MRLTGLHLLLTYQCTLECDHCFAWGSPWQSGTMTLEMIEAALAQAQDLGTVEWVYFEGGEPFLYYAALLQAARRASERGFKVGVVSNGYWATSLEDALCCLRPFTGLVQDLTISCDRYHLSDRFPERAQAITAAALQLGMPLGIIEIAQPEAPARLAMGQLPEGTSSVMFRGRAVETLAAKARHRPWTTLAECPYEDLREPGRVHLDPFGNLHLCQGIVVGNITQRSLREICETYDPEVDPVVGPLLQGGPAQLVREYAVAHRDDYADACHLCYEARVALRHMFPGVLTPDQMFGVSEGG